ncbi:hypothetical protein [Phenylobacterium sp.]|jgi:hypothetical protein|uniref:hypothetical protein n=1 Tax=Phenylobacterium sp. TaxID=1871053 RepID=UPI002F40001F
MRPGAASLMVARAAPAVLVGANAIASPSGYNPVLAWPAGAVAGNVALVAVASTYLVNSVSFGDGLTAPVGWSKLTSLAWPTVGYTSAALTKLLAGGDVTAPPALNHVAGGPIFTRVYRGCSAIALRQTATRELGDHQLIFPGIVKSANCKGLVSVVFDRNPDLPGPTEPTGWDNQITSAGVGFWSGASADLLRANRYHDNDPIIWTGFSDPDPIPDGEGGFIPQALPQVGFLFELT